MRVCFCGSRWLGARCLESLQGRDGIELIVDFQEVGRAIPGDPEPGSIASDMPAAEFRTKAPDLIVSVLNGYIFKPDDLAAAPIVNLHAAALPEYRGCNMYSWALVNKESYYGTTLHYVDEGVDTGPIIAQSFVAVLEQDDALSLYRRSMCAAHDLFENQLDRLLSGHAAGGRLPARAQDESRARYYPRDSIEQIPPELRIF